MQETIRILLPCLLLVLSLFRGSFGQTTDPSITSTTSEPLTDPSDEQSEDTTLSTADSAATTVEEESANFEEATTEGQESNNRFESTKTGPSANQEATTPTPDTNPGGQTNSKKQDTKTPWKFGRGGSAQNGWSIGPTANNGYPQWKKEKPLLVGSGPEVAQAGNAQNNDQAYIVWSAGQGNPPHGWTLNGGQDSWSPGEAVPTNTGWNQGDTPVDPNQNPEGWDTGEWTEEQPVNDDGSQGAWTDDEDTPVDNRGGGWANEPPGGWNVNNGNPVAWQNGPPVAGKVPPPGWTQQGNEPAGGWDDSSAGQVVNNGGWVAPQPVQQNGGNGWAPPPEQVAGNPPPSAVQGGWNPPNGQWTQPQNAGPVTFDNVSPGGDWSNGQENGGTWNPNSQNGGQNPALSWKVYNEDTQTMENIGDDSGWKVVGNGGPDGWKLVNENGNIEWKIENVNGEWRVISADDLPTQDNSTSPSNETMETTTLPINVTTEDTLTTTTPTPNTLDDKKQGRYIVWKFSDNGKGEARLYSGDGAEPVVWTVGGNQFWKETASLNEGNNNGKSSWNANTGANPTSDTSSPVNNGWINSSQKLNSGPWQNSGAIPSQNSGWQAGGGGGSPQVQNAAWKTGSQPAIVIGSWKDRRPPAPNSQGWQTGGQNKPVGNQWKAGGSVAPTNKWQSAGSPPDGPSPPTTWKSNGPAPPVNVGTSPSPTSSQNWNTGNSAQQNGWNKNIVTPQKIYWTNSVPGPQPNSGWQNQSPVVNNGWNRGSKQPPTLGGWQTSEPTNQNPPPQVIWHNGGAPSQPTNGGWVPRGNKQGKGRGKNPAKGGRSNGWQPNKSSNNIKNNARGSRNNHNSGTSWNQGVAVTTQASWVGTAAPSIAPPPDNSNGGVITNWQNAGSPGGGSGGWSVNPQIAAGQNGQTVPYIIVIKQPDPAPVGGAANPWSNTGNNVNTKKSKNRYVNKPKNNRRGYKMNPAGSSGWQWNPQGGSGGWKWNEGWMGSGGGFGGWMNDKGTMYSGWRPTKTNPTPVNAQQTGGGSRTNKKKGKMVFVFGSKKNQARGPKPNSNGKKRGRQIIILDYTGGKSSPQGEDGVKKDVESVIQALRLAKLASPQSTAVWKRGQPQNQQQWGR